MAKITLLGRLFNLNGTLCVRIDGLENALETVGFEDGENVYVTIESCNNGTENNDKLRHRD